MIRSLRSICLLGAIAGPLVAANHQIRELADEDFQWDVVQNNTQLRVVQGEAARTPEVAHGAVALRVENAGNESGWPHFRLHIQEMRAAISQLDPATHALAFAIKSDVAWDFDITISVHDADSGEIVPILVGSPEPVRANGDWQAVFVEMRPTPQAANLTASNLRTLYLHVVANNHWNTPHVTFFDRFAWVPKPRGR